MGRIPHQTLLILIAGVCLLWWSADRTSCDLEGVAEDAESHTQAPPPATGEDEGGAKSDEAMPDKPSAKKTAGPEQQAQDDHRQQRLKEIVARFHSQVESRPPQPSCPGWSVWSRKPSPSDVTFAALGSLFLPVSQHPSPSSSLLARVVEDVCRELGPHRPPLLMQLASGFGGETADADLMTSLAPFIRSLGVAILSLGNNGVPGRVGVMDSFVHALQANQVEWAGLRAKSSVVVNMNGTRVGVMAFCTAYCKCQGDPAHPLTPARYSDKMATSTVKEIRKLGAEAIIVLMYWGKPHSLSPSEHTLSVARHLGHLNVSLVLGDFPALPQDHAYFGKTLIVFSLGQILLRETSLCWQTSPEGQLEFQEDLPDCNALHPSLHSTLREKERQARIYRFTIHRGGHVTAEYKTVPLEATQGANGRRLLRASPSLGEAQPWIPACSQHDSNCHSCVQF